MDLSGTHIAVIGAGIGGLAAALALRRRGAAVTVIEQAPEIAEVGAGLQISANGMAVLRALEVVGDPPHAGLRSRGTLIRDYRAGRAVAEMPPPRAGPTYYFHRADLIGLLMTAVQRSGCVVRTGLRANSLRSTQDTVTIDCLGGDPVTADCAVAADGGRSGLRAGLNGPEQAEFSHQVAWRATIPWGRTDTRACAVLTMGPGRHMVTYPLRDHTLMNIVAVEERSDWRDEGWRLTGDPEDLRARFSDFGGLAGEVLGQVTTVHLWALFLRPVATHWQDGRVALLGDAAHPTLPFMAQGACLALEDAWVLAASLARATDIAGGLAAYESDRVDRARRVVAAAAANARNFHFRSPMRELAQMALFAFGSRIARRHEWIYGHDVTQGSSGGG